MGLHHPGYMAEDAMMVMQNNVASGKKTMIWPMRVPVATAPPLGRSCWEAVTELQKQCQRWSAQTAEALEFCWRYGGLSSLPYVIKYFCFKVWFCMGLTLFAISINFLETKHSQGIHESISQLLELCPLTFSATLAFSLVFVAVSEQIFGSCMPGEGSCMPLRQLPLTLLVAPVALTLMTFFDIWGMVRVVLYGKAGVVLSHRRKVASTAIVKTSS